MKRITLVMMVGLAILVAAIFFALIGPDRQANKPAVRKTNCITPVQPDGRFEHLMKCSDWRKG